MKTIIAGSRSIKEEELVKSIIQNVQEENDWEISEVISGNADGVDSIGETYAQENSLPLRTFPADWDEHGKMAGPIRNVEMAKVADALIAVWDGESKGTKQMIDAAKKHRLKVEVRTVGEIV